MLSVSTRLHTIFFASRHIQDCPPRFDVVAIDNSHGQPSIVRLHKAALSPQLPPYF
jgi:hypothetical protein